MRTDTLYEENSLNSTTMLARQSSQSFYDQINHRLKDCIINCSPSTDVNATSKDAGRFVFPVILFLDILCHNLCLCVLPIDTMI